MDGIYVDNGIKPNNQNKNTKITFVLNDHLLKKLFNNNIAKTGKKKIKYSNKSVLSNSNAVEHNMEIYDIIIIKVINFFLLMDVFSNILFLFLLSLILDKMWSAVI